MRKILFFLIAAVVYVPNVLSQPYHIEWASVKCPQPNYRSGPKLMGGSWSVSLIIFINKDSVVEKVIFEKKSRDKKINKLAMQYVQSCKATAYIDSAIRLNIDIALLDSEYEISSVFSGLKLPLNQLSYPQRIADSIRPNIVFDDEIKGNPVASFKVVCYENGEIKSIKLIKSSGNKYWDRVAEMAVYYTRVLPLDDNGEAPSSLVIDLRPYE